MTARILCLIILALEIRGLSLSLTGRLWKAFVFYTQLSNMMTAVSAALLLVFGQPYPVSVLRYLSVCMMVMTFFVTTCVLVPMGGDPKKLLWSGNGLYLHVLCPVVSALSYILAEHHAGRGAIPVPVAVTLVYGLTMLCLNSLGKVDGPYPFFRVHKQGIIKTILWIGALMAAITVFSILVWLAGEKI